MARPNLLLITTDQQRSDALGINGNPIVQTPNLDHMAASGVNFTRAYTTTPSCIAARRTILTGRHGATHGLPGYRDGTEFDPPFTLPGLLREAGYQTQLVGKFHQYPQGKRYGFDDLILSETPAYRPGSKVFGRNDYVDWLQEKGIRVHPTAHGIGSNSRCARPFHLAEELHQTSWVADEAVRFLTKRRDPSCPWFLHVSFWAPHPPLVPPRDYFARYAGRADLRPHIGSWTPRFATVPPGIGPDSFRGPFARADIQNAMAGYYGLIDHIDDRISHLLSTAFGYTMPAASEPLWILFASDHGEMLGDHHLFRKSLPYEGSAHVPFFVASRNEPLEARSAAGLVCLEDILPTLLELAEVPVPEDIDGKSLAPVLRGEIASVRDELFGEHSGRTANHWIVHEDLKYIWFARTGEEQLFDLGADPHELEDLSADRRLLEPFRARLRERLAGREDYRFDPDNLTPLAGRPPRAIWGDAAESSP